MIALEYIWEDIRSNHRFMKTRFSPEYLKSVGGLLDRRGFHETKLHLWDNTHRDDLKYQALVLIPIISRLERDEGIQRDNSAGSHILKELAVFKSLR